MIDNRTLESLYLTHIIKLRAFLASRVSCCETASELAQETFVRILSINVGTTIRNPRAFLYRIARNLAIDYHRANSHFSGKFVDVGECEHIPSERPGPEEIVATKQQVERLCRAIDELPPKCRCILIEHKFHSRSHAEIADEYGISRSAVEKHLIRALVYLRRSLG